MAAVRILAFAFALGFVAGCSTQSQPSAAAQTAAKDSAASKPAEPSAVSAQASPAKANETVTAEKGATNEPLPPDLGTRKQGVDWPSFLGPTGDSKSSEKGISTQWPEAGLNIVWQRPLQESYDIGAVSRGRYFQFDREGNQAKLLALNSETGEKLWEFAYPTDYADFYGYNGGPRCSPVVDGDRVYIYGAEGLLHCLKAETGDLVWKVDTVKDFGVVQNFFGIGSTPVIEGDLLIVMVGGSPPESQNVGPGALDRVEGNGSGVVAFDKRTGDVKYKLTDELASYASPKLATIDGRRWCFVFARGGLFGFDPTNGQLDFHYPWRAKILESVNASCPVVAGNEVFISETYGPGSSLLSVHPGGYKIVWKDDERRREKAMQTHWNTAVYHDGYLYGSSGRHESNAELRCIEWKTGKVQWSEPGLTRSSLLYVDGHFICLSENGTLRLLRATPEKFAVLAKWTPLDPKAGPNPFGFGPRQLFNPPAWAAPILSHGLLYVRGEDRVVCIELVRP